MPRIDRVRARYDQEMELLCSLSPRPVLLRTLVSDFGWEQDKLLEMIRALKDRGHMIRLTMDQQSEEWQVCIHPDGWAESKAKAQRYWKGKHA